MRRAIVASPGGAAPALDGAARAGGRAKVSGRRGPAGRATERRGGTGDAAWAGCESRRAVADGSARASIGSVGVTTGAQIAAATATAAPAAATTAPFAVGERPVGGGVEAAGVVGAVDPHACRVGRRGTVAQASAGWD